MALSRTEKVQMGFFQEQQDAAVWQIKAMDLAQKEVVRPS